MRAADKSVAMHASISRFIIFRINEKKRERREERERGEKEEKRKRETFIYIIKYRNVEK